MDVATIYNIYLSTNGPAIIFYLSPSLLHFDRKKIYLCNFFSLFFAFSFRNVFLRVIIILKLAERQRRIVVCFNMFGAGLTAT